MGLAREQKEEREEREGSGGSIRRAGTRQSLVGCIEATEGKFYELFEGFRREENLRRASVLVRSRRGLKTDFSRSSAVTTPSTNLRSARPRFSFLLE